MKAEDYLKEHRIYDDETIYNSAGDMVATLSQLMNDYHDSEVKKLNIPAVIKSVCENCGKDEAVICQSCYDIESQFRECY